MLNKLLYEIKIKTVFGFFSLLLILSLFLYQKYITTKSLIYSNFTKSLKLEYELFLKIHQINRSLNKIEIKNQNFIDSTEMIDEFKKSTPFYVSNKDKEELKYDLKFKFLKKDSIKKTILDKFEGLSEDYIINLNYDNSVFNLYGKVDNNFVLIKRNAREYKELNSKFEYFLLILILLIFLSFIFLMYIVFLKKNLTIMANNMEKDYERLSKETRKVALEDNLTKAASRLKFDERLKDMIKVASRLEEQKFSLIILDIDNFKRVNDTYGHDYGDIVLKEVTKKVKNNIRKSDTLSRWGGEEFTILLPLIQLKEACLIAEKLRELISKIEFEKLDEVTCSFGITEFNKNDDEKTIVKRADDLLYKAKKNGKNRIEY